MTPDHRVWETWRAVRGPIMAALADERCTGDVLVWALLMYLDAARDDGPDDHRPGRRRTGRGWALRITLAHDPADPDWVARVIRSDIPRWEPEDDGRGHGCPVVGPRGGPCRRGRYFQLRKIDPANGSWTWVRPCRIHGARVKAECDELRRRWEANGSPVPGANRGGVLETLFDADWDRLYRWAGVRAKPNRSTEATLSRPRLRLLSGGAG
jgi:hypothetical protein